MEETKKLIKGVEQGIGCVLFLVVCIVILLYIGVMKLEEIAEMMEGM